MPRIKPHQIPYAFEAAQAVVETHRRVSKFLRHGMTLAQIDQFIATTLASLGCESCFYLYTPDKRRHPPFPSHSCLSVNECVVHGTRGYYTKPLAKGDLLKVDIGVFKRGKGADTGERGWVGDAAWTYSFGEPTPQVRALMECGKESLRLGVQQIHPKKQWVDFARAVQKHVEADCGFHLIRGLGGHGIGLDELHGTPFVSNVVPSMPGEWREAYQACEVGTLVAVEPMIAIGTSRTKTVMGAKKLEEWPVYTADGSMSVHYEHDVLVTPEGPKVLTDGLQDLDDIVRE